MLKTNITLLALLLFALTTPVVRSGERDLHQDIAQGLVPEAANPSLIANPNALGPVAHVGGGNIMAYQVFELWTPIWSETQAKVRNGKMEAREGDQKLQTEWERAILALVKDELFYQEAEREHASMLNAIVDRIMQGGAGRPRNQVVTEIRRLMQQDMEKYFRMLASEMVQESGGMLKLHKVLEGRGLTFAEWQERLRKKAFTQSYLHQILKPRTPNPGPRQVQNYYQSHPEEFSRPGTVKFRHIFFSNAKRGGEDAAREAATEVWEKIVDEEISFEAAAAKFSDDPDSRARGGLETEAEAEDPEREAWLTDIRTALREETPGQVGAILESPFGCHVAMLLSVGPLQKVPFNEVRKDIERKLGNKIWEEETDRYFAGIRKSTEIRVVMPSFPRNLSCVAAAAGGKRAATVYNVSLPRVRSGRGAGK